MMKIHIVRYISFHDMRFSVFNITISFVFYFIGLVYQSEQDTNRSKSTYLFPFLGLLDKNISLTTEN